MSDWDPSQIDSVPLLMWWSCDGAHIGWRERQYARDRAQFAACMRSLWSLLLEMLLL